MSLTSRFSRTKEIPKSPRADYAEKSDIGSLSADPVRTSPAGSGGFCHRPVIRERVTWYIMHGKNVAGDKPTV